MQGIAIVGIGCLLPGNKTPEGFYQSLLQQQRYIGQQAIPAISAADFPDFDLPPVYSELDDFFLQTLFIAREALRDCTSIHASQCLARTGLLLGTREACGPKTFELFSPVYLNELESSIQELLDEPSFRFDYRWQAIDNSPLNAFEFSYPVTLAAQALCLGGPSFALDAACASSLFCIKLAAEYLQNGQADMMIAGGLMSGFADEALQHYFASLGVAADGDTCRPLDRNSAGISGGDGGGVVLLKRLDDAERDGDRIYAVIDTVAWRNHAGKGKLLLAPSREGQLATYEDTYNTLANQGIRPEEIDFIECHATGTPTGDMIELNTLDKFFARHDHSPLFGSVKGNVGHLMAGSGIAALIKLIYSIREGTIPATCSVTTPLASRGKRFSANNLVTTNTAWPDKPNQAPRRGAISSFGFGGAHAHMVVSEYQASDKPSHTLRTEQPENNNSSTERLALICVGARLGNLSDIDTIATTLQSDAAAGATPSQRLRGIELNGDISKNFLPDDLFCHGIQSDAYDIDLLFSGVASDCHGEVLDKELQLLNAANCALQQAGINKADKARVGVLVAARQNLCYVQFHLEHYLPGMIGKALDNSAIALDDTQRDKLVELAQAAVLHNSNGGFDFIATGIGPIVASRIAAVWNLCGPTIKLCNLESSLVRSFEVAQLLLHSDELDAVLIAVGDNDPALENRILLKKYADSLGLPKTAAVIDDSAFAFVVTSETKAREQGKSALAYIDNISCQPEAVVKSTIDQYNSQEHTGWYGSRMITAREGTGGKQSLRPYSLATSAAMAVVNAIGNTPNQSHSQQQSSASMIYGLGVEGLFGTLSISPVSGGARPVEAREASRQRSDTSKRSMIKTIVPHVATIRSVVLAKASSQTLETLQNSQTLQTSQAFRQPNTEKQQADNESAELRKKPATQPVIPNTFAQQTAKTHKRPGTEQIAAPQQKTVTRPLPHQESAQSIEAASATRNGARHTATQATEINARVLPPADYYVQLFKQNCELQQAYCTNQSLLLTLLNEHLGRAGDSIQTDRTAVRHRSYKRNND